MKRALKDIIVDVEKQLRGYEYGFKKTLASNANREKISLEVDDLEKMQEFDCLCYAIKGMDLLKDHGVETQVCFGKDEHNLWETHSYLKTDEGETIDFTPTYKTLGAKHTEKGRLSEKDIQKYRKKHAIPLNESIPMHYDPESKSLLKIRIGIINDVGSLVKLRMPQKVVYLSLVEFDDNSQKYVNRGTLEIYYNEGKIGGGNLNKMIEENIFQVISHYEGLREKILSMESEIDCYFVKFLKRIF
jgi:hypothetical protein